MDFIGYWGGYIHSSVERFSPDLIGTSPSRVSVIFGRHDDTVFVASELYASRQQRITEGPRTRVIGARLALVEYESVDNGFEYICSHRFRLDDAVSITYLSTIEVYDRSNHSLMGIVRGQAKLKRLRTRRERLEFAQPGGNQVARRQISVKSELFSP